MTHLAPQTFFKFHKVGSLAQNALTTSQNRETEVDPLGHCLRPSWGILETPDTQDLGT